MSIKGVQQLRARFQADNKIDNNEVNQLIKEAEDGFLFFKHVSGKERAELRDLLEKNQDKFEPGAKEKLAGFLGLRAQTVTTDDIAKAFALLQDAMDACRDPSGNVNLEAVAAKVSGDPAAEAALNVIRNEFSSMQPVEVSDGCSGRRTEMREMPATSLNPSKASSVFDALVSAKSGAAALDANADGVLQKPERDAAGGTGLDDKIVKAAVDKAGAIEPIATGC